MIAIRRSVLAAFATPAPGPRSISVSGSISWLPNHLRLSLRPSVSDAASPVPAFPTATIRQSAPRLRGAQNPIQYPVGSVRLSSMNSIGSAHADRLAPPLLLAREHSR